MSSGQRSPLSRSSGSGPRRQVRAYRSGPVLLRLLLIIIVAALLIDVLPTPWALDIGGHFNILGEWNGWGPVTASNGGSYLLFTHLHGGITNGDGTSCNFRGCDSLTGTAQLCSASGRHYTFELSGAVHGWLSTDQSVTNIDLSGGSPTPLPSGWVVAFHGTWHGPVLPVEDTDNSFTEVFTPAGNIRKVTSTADTGTARGRLRFGSLAAFTRACHALAGGGH